MKIRPKNLNSLFRLRHGPWRTRLLAIAALLAWLTLPMSADVIDDFEHGKRFYTYAQGGIPEFEFVEGQVRCTLPNASTTAPFWYIPTYELPEGTPVEFKVDVVSLNSSDAFARLSVAFTKPPDVVRSSGRFYSVYWLWGRVVATKEYERRVLYWLDTSTPYTTEAVTLSLTLTRQGEHLKVGVKGVQRDDPDHVVFAREWTDSPSIQGDGDNGPPMDGPVTAVGIGCGSISSTPPRPQGVFDNVECSANPMPQNVGISLPVGKGAHLEWQSISIVLEALDVNGPWVPCPEVVSCNTGVLSVSTPLEGLNRFFRVVPGMQTVDRFDKTWDFTSWETASLIPGQILRPVFSMSGGRGRLRGVDTRNTDVVLFWGFPDPPMRDSVASVDIADWDETMEDAAFGILLRVKSEQEVWLCETEGLPQQRYAGILTFKKAESPADSELSITGPGGEVLATQRFPVMDPAKEYRLRFWAVGDRLTIELFDLANLATPLITCAATDGRVPAGRDALFGTKSVTGTYDVTIDNYELSGAFE